MRYLGHLRQQGVLAAQVIDECYRVMFSACNETVMAKDKETGFIALVKTTFFSPHIRVILLAHEI